jgi:phosphoribosyl 1,2-cyclic phosphodiesterase
MGGYGGNTSCVEITLSDGSEVILDAGTGIRDLGRARHRGSEPVHVLLTHLHLDHIQGLMFFSPLFDPHCDIRVSGPAALGGSLINRLARYISAPLAPVEIRELPARVRFEDIPGPSWQIGPARIQAELVNHRGPTLGYRITDGEITVAYIPDHEPSLGQSLEHSSGAWISGLALARDADLLIHDCQYTGDEYAARIGWGHSSVSDSVTFAKRSGARRLAAFHHDPTHDDDAIERIIDEGRSYADGRLDDITAAAERDTVELR